MTVKLLSAWGDYPLGAAYTSTAQTEADMVARGLATTDLTGATAWPRPAAPNVPDSFDEVNAQLNKGVQLNGSTVNIGGVAATAAQKAAFLAGLGLGEVVTVDPVTGVAGLAWYPNSGAVEPSRGERRFVGEKVTTRTVTLRNPSTTLAYTGSAASINIGFAEGECVSPDCLQVLNSSGAAVSFQWEGAKRPFDDADMSTWPDGSVRAGKIWLVVTMAASATSDYTINCYRTPRGVSGAKAVAHTLYTGTYPIYEFIAGGVMARFESGGGAYNLRRFQDISNANFDLFQGVIGFQGKIRQSPTDYLSSNAAKVTDVVPSLVGSDAFGYGVVFQEFQTVWRWVDFPSISTRIRYRMFSDGTLQIDTRFINTADVASAPHRLSSLMTVGATSLTATYDSTKIRKTFDYGTSNFQIFAFSRGFQHNYTQGADGLQTAEAWGLLEETATAVNYEIGLNAITPIYAGAEFQTRYFLQKIGVEAADDLWKKTMTPIVAQAVTEKPITDLQDFAARARSVAPIAIEELSRPEFLGRWDGVKGMIRLLKDGSSAALEALADYHSVCQNIQGGAINPATASNYYDRWNTGGAGLEYQGRNTQVLYWLHKMFTASGDTANATLVASYIHAYADAIVSMEVASGGLGRMNLRGAGESSYEDVWNARTTAICGLATSLSIVSNATRQATLDRLVAAYNAGEFAIGKWAYAPWSPWYTGAANHYYGYQTYELLSAKKRLPSIALPSVDLLASLRQAMGPAGLMDEWNFQLVQTRRGAISSNWCTAACAALYPTPDYGLAQESLRHADFDLDPLGTTADGWWNLGWSAPGQRLIDVRVLAEVCLFAGV